MNEQKTTFLKKGAPRKYLLVDLNGKTLGRAATQIADMLRGKNKPTYTPFVDGGDFVVAINVDKIHLTGNKWDDKKYYKHSGYMGGLKEFTAKELQKRHPDALLTKAVKGMLPKNSLSRNLLKKLKIYVGENHPHQAQMPEVVELT